MIPSLEPGEKLICLGLFRRAMCVPGAIVVAKAPVLEPELIIKRVHKVDEDGSFEVIGDNLEVSTDSRLFGSLEENRYQGRAFLAYWPRIRWLRLKS